MKQKPIELMELIHIYSSMHTYMHIFFFTSFNLASCILSPLRDGESSRSRPSAQHLRGFSGVEDRPPAVPDLHVPGALRGLPQIFVGGHAGHLPARVARGTGRSEPHGPPRGRGLAQGLGGRCAGEDVGGAELVPVGRGAMVVGRGSIGEYRNLLLRI